MTTLTGLLFAQEELFAIENIIIMQYQSSSDCDFMAAEYLRIPQFSFENYVNVW